MDNKHAVVGIVHTQLEAENLIDSLRIAGFSEGQLSALLPDKDGVKDFAHNNASKAPEGAVAGAVTGGVVGGTLGLLAGIGALAIPGVGPLIAAGPIMAALSGAAVGASGGGLVGSLIGLGIPEYEAKMYEGKIRDGNVLLAAHCFNKEEIKTAEELFKKHNATDIHCVGEAAVKKAS
ncbi:MAG: hypothetical protein K2X81_22095 [Candidatus Obscuribacterales bacterium]|nr:hypothetical protein [Candidatus Obscuribacterales bacterium]